MKRIYTFTAKVWLYPGKASWHFVGVPKEESMQIKNGVKVKAGFGSVPVTVTVGTTAWDTSIFRDGKAGQYVLPLKAAVRKREDIIHGEYITLTIKLRLPIMSE